MVATGWRTRTEASVVEMRGAGAGMLFPEGGPERGEGWRQTVEVKQVGADGLGLGASGRLCGAGVRRARTQRWR